MRAHRMKQHGPEHFREKLVGGIFIIGFGVLLLLNKMNMGVPHAFASWEMVLILVGITSLIKHKFQRLFGLVPIAIGAVFMAKELFPHMVDTRIVWPCLIIVFGIAMFLRAFRTKKGNPKCVRFEEVTEDNSTEDFVESTAFFGGVKKNIVSKNFKGGKISSVFGGTELNLTHADFENQVTVDVHCVFGGIEILVPSNWKVHTEMTSMFGGIDDKRQVSLIDENSGKMLILKGNCFFGGVEIASYA